MRTRHLIVLWKKLCAVTPMPQVDKWLSQEFRGQKQFGSTDRKWYSDRIFGAFRFSSLIVFFHMIERQSPDKCVAEIEDEFVSLERWMKVLQNIQPEKLFQILDGILSNAASMVSHIQWLQSTQKGRMLLAGVPLWLQPQVAERFADDRVFLEQLKFRPPLWLRINRVSDALAVREDLEAQGLTVQFEAEDALMVSGQKGILETKSSKEGLFEIQDLASQRIGRCLSVQPGQFIWDCCAGGGGKTMQIAAGLKQKGAVCASDVRSYKLEEVKKRAKRAKFDNVRTLEWNGEKLPKFPREISMRAGFDTVLVDAPCSSSGTWRRNPDAKLKVTAQGLQTVSQLQLDILSKVCAAVKKGGTLVYSTCSWLHCENEDVVARFLQAHPEFTLLSQECFGSPWHDSDTMFAAVLKK